MRWMNLIAAATVALVVAKWLYAWNIFRNQLWSSAALMYRQAMRSVRRFYLIASATGILGFPLSYAFDFSPPGTPLLSFLLGIVGVGALGLPPCFLLAGSSEVDTHELFWILNSATKFARTV